MIDRMTPLVLNCDTNKHEGCHMSDTVICKQCGNEFYPVRSNQECCNSRCSAAYIWNNSERDKRIQRRPVYTKKCRFCEKEIISTNAMKVYCSESCKVNYLNKHRAIDKYELKVCPVCGKEFLRDFAGKMYCGKLCRNKAGNDRRKSLSGLRSFQTRKRTQFSGNWIKALERDNFSCQLCGKHIPPGQKTSKPIYGLFVHHWDGSNDRKTQQGNHSIDNLVTLCQKCHNLFHTEVHLVKIDGQYFMKGEIFAKLGITEIKVMPL